MADNSEVYRLDDVKPESYESGETQEFLLPKDVKWGLMPSKITRARGSVMTGLVLRPLTQEEIESQPETWGFCDCTDDRAIEFMNEIATMSPSYIHTEIKTAQKTEETPLTRALCALALKRARRGEEIPKEWISDQEDALRRCMAYLAQDEKRPVSDHSREKYDALYSYIYNILGVKDEEGLPYLLMQELQDRKLIDHGSGIRCAHLAVGSPYDLEPSAELIEEVRKQVDAFYAY